MRRFKLVTLGCKLNQCESEELGLSLSAKAAYRPCRGGEPADLVVVNTCTVTERAAVQSRQAIRRAIREHPGAFVVVTGCLAATDPETLRAIPGVGRVVGRKDKAGLADSLCAARTEPPQDEGAAAAGRRAGFPSSPAAGDPLAGRTRAFVKIQDGCDAFCSYCIVPYARGPSRSVSPRRVLERIGLLAARGFREVVLTGVHIGRYGLDLTPPRTLAELLEDILGGGFPLRVRLSSIEPLELTEPLLEVAVRSGGRVCPHFHIPLQSGDAAILARMRRPYGPADFRGAVAAVRARFPDAAIGADVLVGFPGESEEAFENTFRLIADLPLSYLHVFPFSPRPGTAAFGFDDRIDPAKIRARCGRLRRLGESKRLLFHRGFVGRAIEVLTETRRDPQSGLLRGVSANYLRVRFAGEDAWMNRLARVRITAADSRFLSAALDSPAVSGTRGRSSTG